MTVGRESSVRAVDTAYGHSGDMKYTATPKIRECQLV